MQTQDVERKGPEEVAAEEARIRLGELMSRAGYGDERIVLTRHGKPLAALVSLRDLAALESAA